LVATFDGCEYLIPVTFDVGAVGVQVCLESGVLQDALTESDFLGNRDADADRNDAQIRDDSHISIVWQSGGAGKSVAVMKT